MPLLRLKGYCTPLLGLGGGSKSLLRLRFTADLSSGLPLRNLFLFLLLLRGFQDWEHGFLRVEKIKHSLPPPPPPSTALGVYV